MNQMIKSSYLVIFFEKINIFYHVMIIFILSFQLLSFASSIYLWTYSLSLTSRCSDWTCLLIDQMSDVDQMKLSQILLMLFSRQNLDKIVCWHICSRTSIHTDSTRLNLLFQSVLMNINMFQRRVKFQHFFFQHAKNLIIVAMYVQLLHRIVLNWFEKSFSSDCLLRDSTQNQ
jgi:hypothetical protein